MSTLQVVVMGVSGAGKSTVGALLAHRLGLPYADGDDFHSQANKQKLSSGVPLDDRDRAPWLAEVGAWLAAQGAAVVACSALKRSYRAQLLAAAPRAQFVYLRGERALLERRVKARTHHFMPVSLLDSQLATLEPLEADEPGFTLELGDDTPQQLVEQATARLQQPADAR